jgi:formate dehydrogenase major subunit
LKPIAAHAQPLKIKYAKETTTICPYYAVGCGIIVATRKDKVINMEGDPDHPINKGALCTKGGSIYQLDRPLYRAPYSNQVESCFLGLGY